VGFHRLACFVLSATPLLFSASTEATSSVTLNCSGKWWRTQPNVTGESVQGMPLIVDFDQKEIRGSYGSFNITSTTRSIVFFERPYSENGRPGTMYGWINRISGETEFHGSRKGETGYFIVYHLNCKPAQAGHRLCLWSCG
jgi:hypothetical protein